MLLVRPAVLADIPQLLRFGKHFVGAAPYGGKADEASICSQLRRCIDEGLAFVADKDGQLIGGIVGISSALWYDQSTRVAAELAWWVEPAHREGLTAFKLLNAFENKAKELGHSKCVMMLITLMQGESIGRIYERRGFRLTEQAYIKDLV
jgi:GNAT superfamily N-acetyltransferase